MEPNKSHVIKAIYAMEMSLPELGDNWQEDPYCNLQIIGAVQMNDDAIVHIKIDNKHFDLIIKESKC